MRKEMLSLPFAFVTEIFLKRRTRFINIQVTLNDETSKKKEKE
jgi:hypothetical protein